MSRQMIMCVVNKNGLTASNKGISMVPMIVKKDDDRHRGDNRANGIICKAGKHQ
jgi:hypothetical protein